MSKIKDASQRARHSSRSSALVTTASETTERYIRVMVKAGADMVEIGIPFSDPTAGRSSYTRSKHTRSLYRHKNQRYL